MKRVDLKKELKRLYRPSAKEVLKVDVPAFQFLMIDGEGDPKDESKHFPLWMRLGSKPSPKVYALKFPMSAPFSEERPTIQQVHDFIGARSALTRKHHEIYLSDIRRAEPSKWKTIIRQPMR